MNNWSLKVNLSKNFVFNLFQNHKAKLEIAEREKLLLQKEISTQSKGKVENAMGSLGQGDSAGPQQ